MIAFLIELASGYAKGIGIGLGTLTITTIPFLYKKAKTALLGKDNKDGSRSQS
ncbi:hypothetical protein MKX66_30520 [Bacillus sp. FSL R9-9530]|uniref:hypothetical protein n=1 Tax=Bacillus sp. FSL R9-9530 TaxID=2921593 RepID=UPI0030FB0874